MSEDIDFFDEPVPIETRIQELSDKLNDAGNELEQFTTIPVIGQRHILIRIFERVYAWIITVLVPLSIGFFHEATLILKTDIKTGIIALSLSTIFLMTIIIIVVVWLNNKDRNRKRKKDIEKNNSFYKVMTDKYEDMHKTLNVLMNDVRNGYNQQIEEAYEVMSQSVSAFSQHMNELIKNISNTGLPYSPIPESDPIIEDDNKIVSNTRKMVPQRPLKRKVVNKRLVTDTND